MTMKRRSSSSKGKWRRNTTTSSSFEPQFAAGDPSAIVEYFSLVLDRSVYPEAFPKQHRMAFVPESKQLVLEYELPTVDAAVPGVKQHRYVRTRDAIEESAR